MLSILYSRYTTRQYRAYAREGNKMDREIRKEARSHMHGPDPVYQDEFGRITFDCPYGLVRA